MAQKGSFKQFFSKNKKFFALVITIFTLFMMSSTLMLIFLTRPAGKIAVPDVVDEKFASIYGTLVKKDLKPVIKFYDSSDLVDGVVIAQYPEAGKIVTRGSRVKLTVTRNNLRVKVPDLTSLQLAIAKNNLATLTVGSQRAALETGVITYVPSDSAAENTVIDQNPKSDQFVTKDTPINLLVSMGNLQAEKVVPQIAGQYVDLVYGLLVSRNILAAQNVVEADAENGMVLDQSIPSGSPAGPMQISVAFREGQKRYYRAYDKVTFQVPKEREGTAAVYEAWVTDDGGKRLCLKRECNPGDKVDFVFFRKGNAAIEIITNGKKIKTIHQNAYRF